MSTDGALYRSLNLHRTFIVKRAEDLPDAVAGVRTLEAGVCYVLNGDIDLNGDRLQMAGVCAIRGTSSETSSLTSTGLGVGVPLITTGNTLAMQDLTIRDIDIALAVDGSGGGPNVALDWRAVNFAECEVGTIENVDNFIMTDSAFLAADGLVFDGSANTIAFANTIFVPRPGGTMLTIPATATVARRFRAIYSSFVVLSGMTGLDVDEGAIANPETYILDTCNFAGGGTYQVGADRTSLRALFRNCVGIQNSASLAHYYMSGNATPTPIASTGVPVKVLGTTVEGTASSKFTHGVNRATFDGSLAETYEVSVRAALSSVANNELALYVAKNGSPVASSVMPATANAGGRVEASGTLGVVDIAQGDYIEVWVANNTNPNAITVTDLQVLAKRLS